MKINKNLIFKNEMNKRFTDSDIEKVRDYIIKTKPHYEKIDGETYFCYIDINAEEFFGKELSDKLLDFVLFVEEMEKENEKEQSKK